MRDNEKQRALYLTHSIELLVWLIIILFVVAFFTITNIAKQRNDNDYTIFMNDVDGLIVGSPVRAMGVEIGHVTKIKPTNNEVFIKFIIDDENTTIPQGTVATVEFTGMAGSKSLELYLPNSDKYIDKSTPLLTVQSPKRLHDALGLLNDMFDKLGSIIYVSTSFGNKIKFLDIPVNNEQDINKLLQYADGMVDDTTEKIQKFNKKVKGGGK